MSRIRITSLIAAVAAGTVLAGCGGSSGTKLTTTNSSTNTTTNPPPTSGGVIPTGILKDYNPRIDPAQFTNVVTNRWFPMHPGLVMTYVGVRDGNPTKHVFTVTHDVKTVMGVKCLVIQDVVTQNGSLIEKTTDWYSQDMSGNVWYFGEDTAEYANGVVTNTQGTWEAGVDKAKPGIIMPANPKVGLTYRQEYRPGVALDIAKIIGLNGTRNVPAGSFKNLVMTDERNPLDPSFREHKWYAAGIGFVHSVRSGGGHTETTNLAKVTG
jgi:hypothetical protein